MKNTITTINNNTENKGEIKMKKKRTGKFRRASLTDSNDAFDTSGIVQLDSDYSFTIDNTQSYADIPVTTEKGTPLS